MGNHNIKPCFVAQSLIKCELSAFLFMGLNSAVNSLWPVCIFQHSFSTAVGCMEKLVLGKYVDIFSSLMGWARVLLKECVWGSSCLSVSSWEWGRTLNHLAEQLHLLTTVGSIAVKGRGEVSAQHMLFIYNYSSRDEYFLTCSNALGEKSTHVIGKCFSKVSIFWICVSLRSIVVRQLWP